MQHLCQITAAEKQDLVPVALKRLSRREEVLTEISAKIYLMFQQ